MLFNKHKKEEAERLAQLEKQRIQKEEERKQKIKLEEEEAKRKEAEKKVVKPNPYKFSEPDPKPKELLSVLKNMLKKLFPETKKAYLVIMSYKDKSGYLLICDIAPKFLKIIKLYLDGETKMVRNGMPIDCILFSKSGSITENIEPFYVKAEIEHGSSSKAIADKIKAELASVTSDESADEATLFEDLPDFDFESTKSTPNGFDIMEIEEEKEHLIDEIEESELEADLEVQKAIDDVMPIAESYEKTAEEIVSESEDADSVQTDATDKSNVTDAHDSQSNDENGENTPQKEHRKNICVDKTELFAAINKSEFCESNAEKDNCIKIFAEYMFYIPIQSEDKEQNAIMLSDVLLSVPENEVLKVVPLINRDTEIKAIPMFTEFESARDFASKSSSKLMCMKYKDYKTNVSEGKILIPSVEGVVINPADENIILPPDCTLL